jgi:uncharacterized membrane protein YdbT with pleckstrin-like domain
MNPDEWQSKEEWKKEEALRRENEEASRRDREREAELRSEWEREEKQRRFEAVVQAVLITIGIVSLVAIILPGVLYVCLFIFGWAFAAYCINKIKSVWLRCVLHVLAPIALIFAMFWLIGLGKEAFHVFEFGSPSDN